MSQDRLLHHEVRRSSRLSWLTRGVALMGLAAVFLGVGTGPAAAQVATEVDSATGAGTFSTAFGADVTFAFSAESGPSGENATGTYQSSYVTSWGSTGTNTGVVDCLRVEGNRATIGGTRTDLGSNETADRFFYVVEDNTADGQPDRYSETYFFPSSSLKDDCTTGSPVQGYFTITSGEIVVVDGRPQCADGSDNDGDGRVDSDDNGCDSPTDNSERPNDKDKDKKDKP